MTTHELKCWPEFFDAVKRGGKTFEIRKNDRGYQTGDVLVLRKYDPNGRLYGHTPGVYVGPTGKHHREPEQAATVRVRVTYMLSDWGLERGYVCMAIEVEREPAQEGGEQ